MSHNLAHLFQWSWPNLGKYKILKIQKTRRSGVAVRFVELLSVEQLNNSFDRIVESLSELLNSGQNC